MTRPRYTADERTRTRLDRQLGDIAGAALSEVRITPALYGDGTVWCAMALDLDGREVPLAGRTREVASLLREAFPGARWNRAQDYDVASGKLRKHVIELPAALAEMAGESR
ncbi:hypothetical protein ACFZC3_15215 [Streptomyces sp. NPDC007903]|uniref:hypothetical protein n=1 Tax=Streptomyces sp. NPDC007903 TaxID=3364786 RepID=UPI0036EBAABB